MRVVAEVAEAEEEDAQSQHAMMLKKHRKMHWQRWMIRRLHSTVPVILQVSPLVHGHLLNCRKGSGSAEWQKKSKIRSKH